MLPSPALATTDYSVTTRMSVPAGYSYEGIFARSNSSPGDYSQNLYAAQIDEGLRNTVAQAGLDMDDVVVVGLDTPGPATAAGVREGPAAGHQLPMPAQQR